MKILLVGGTGFIGHYIYNSFIIDHNIYRTYAHSKTDEGIYFDANINSISNILNTGYDLIINNLNPLLLSYYSFVRAIEELTIYCKETNCRLINISSISSDENNKFTDSYSMKKHIADELILNELGLNNVTMLRFTQVFDYEGLAKKSQSGIYFIMDSIKNEKPIHIFANSTKMMRNYLPVTLAVDSIKYAVDLNIFGIHNIYVPSFTKSMNELINIISEFNSNYDKNAFLLPSEKIGTEYYLPPFSAKFENWANKANDLNYYLLKTYNEYR